MTTALDLTDPVALAEALIACPSVTPATGAVFDALEAMLAPLGFKVERFLDGPDDPGRSRICSRCAGTAGPHFAFAGHLDVVPPGEGWTSGAFEPEVRGDLLYGRGAVDMKGAIAAFVAAVARVPACGRYQPDHHRRRGRPRHLRHPRADRAHGGARREARFLPRRRAHIGQAARRHDQDRRRGSVIWIDVPGKQGHVAYPHLADNPIPKLVAILAEIDAIVLDEGNDWFQPRISSRPTSRSAIRRPTSSPATPRRG
jgi:succinyl-diaminopimelate desuccinylase